GVRLADLGLYRLASAAAPERIFQLADRETELGEFPPPNAERGHRSNLPLQSTRFFGREPEIAGLGALLERSRLVTLTGSGGSGKPRRALEVARQLGERFAGAVWFVPLADLVEPSRIPEAILDAVGLPGSPELAPLDQVVAFLARQPSLLVLDNYEH